MIQAKNVSMKFDLGVEATSFKETFIHLFSGKKKKEKKDFWALTLLKVVSGVMKPTKGSVTVNGVISPMIELGAGFDPELTARENIYLNGAILGYSKDFIDEKFDEIVEFSELRDFLDAPVKNFSSGMTAKLAFSIATVVNPEILIVDEILSVGDIKMMEMIMGGTTVLYVSHSMESIEELCDKVIWLEHGHVKMIGETKEICNAYYLEQMGETKEESLQRKKEASLEKENKRKMKKEQK